MQITNSEVTCPTFQRKDTHYTEQQINLNSITLNSIHKTIFISKLGSIQILIMRKEEAKT